MSAEISLSKGNGHAQKNPSMGPRSDERGNQVETLTMQHAELLQWGRARMSAEMPPKAALLALRG